MVAPSMRAWPASINALARLREALAPNASASARSSRAPARSSSISNSILSVMRALKSIVIFLGVMCVGAFGFLVYVVMTGVGKGPAEMPPSAPRPPVAGSAWPDLALGMQIVDAFALDGLLAVTTTTREDATLVVLIDPKTGRVVGRVVGTAR